MCVCVCVCVWLHRVCVCVVPGEIPKCLENGRHFVNQKCVKNGPKMCFSKKDHGAFGVLQRDNSAHFEPILIQIGQFSPFRHIYAPACTPLTYLRAVLWSHIELGRGV